MLLNISPGYICCTKNELYLAQFALFLTKINTLIITSINDNYQLHPRFESRCKSFKQGCIDTILGITNSVF